tara:strand:+ start:1065 stop:1250 length:186 start_codon:yes stop_codon:yes gene_type:complete
MNEVEKLLHKAHLIINDATGTDIPKSVTEKAKVEARKIYKQIKELDSAMYEVLKQDDKKLK